MVVILFKKSPKEYCESKIKTGQYKLWYFLSSLFCLSGDADSTNIEERTIRLTSSQRSFAEAIGNGKEWVIFRWLFYQITRVRRFG